MLPTLLSTIAQTTVRINGNVSSISDAEALGIILTILAIIMIPVLIISIIGIVATWKIFEKCGEAGWKSIIPIYNTIIMFRIAGINPIWILLCFVPGIGSVLFFLVSIVMDLRLARGFGKSESFAVGLIIPAVSLIFTCILGFSKDTTWNANKIDYTQFDFLNSEEAKARAAGHRSKTASSKKAEEDPWVESK
jgi:hypothetical protein